ncbi:MAG: leucine-rich repeat domain-containing protein [Candidatus Aenigmarchaeota archaeon]|nr:leucine-rich repeat domain-containing protein [Candidatus Aenigmarchaeota archaeon]
MNKNLVKLAKEHSDTSVVEKGQEEDGYVAIMVWEPAGKREYLIPRNEYNALVKIESLRIDDAEPRTSKDLFIPGVDEDYIFYVAVRGAHVIHYNVRPDYGKSRKLDNIPDVIKDLEFLESIDISFNEISSIEPLSSLVNLKSINARGNKIENVAGIGSTQLDSLDISMNPIKSFDGVYKAKTLKKLVANLTKPGTLDGIEKLQKLEYLDVGYSGISSLPKSLKDMGSLKTIDISGNNFDHLPEPLGETSFLEELSMRNCGMKNIDGIRGISSLKRLSLCQNKLSEVPEEIGNLRSLENLDVSQNELKTLPRSITNLKGLQRLDASENKIDKLPPLCGLSIEHLYFNNNIIRNFSEPFQGLAAKYVSLYSNNEGADERMRLKEALGEDAWIDFSGPDMY